MAEYGKEPLLIRGDGTFGPVWDQTVEGPLLQLQRVIVAITTPREGLWFAPGRGVIDPLQSLVNSGKTDRELAGVASQYVSAALTIPGVLQARFSLSRPVDRPNAIEARGAITLRDGIFPLYVRAADALTVLLPTFAPLPTAAA